VCGWCTGAFEDDDIIHVEGEVNPVRDLEIIHNELRLKVSFVHACIHVCILTCAVLDPTQDLEASATLLVCCLTLTCMPALVSMCMACTGSQGESSHACIRRQGSQG
jgi:hypothetical protein